MKITSILLALAFMLSTKSINAQSNSDSLRVETEFNSLDEALKNPSKVYRLNLSNQKNTLSDSLWARFTNLEYLSLKNDHLKRIPAGIGLLKNLKVLDLSGNDFEILPLSFGKLKNLQELYLNDDKNFQFNKSIQILSKLPNLKSLHVDNDNLKKIPQNIT